MRCKSIVRSATKALTPVHVVNAKTGESVLPEEWEKNVNYLIRYVRDECVRIYSEDLEQVQKDAEGLKGSANSYGRKLGYSSSYKELPKGVLAKSRINELFLHKLFSETNAYMANKNDKKGDLAFGEVINLGAVNAQMASLLVNQNGEIELRFKVWEGDYIFTFQLPEYAKNRNLVGISLPLITPKGFIFCLMEEPTPLQGKGIIGVDLGRVEPFTAAVVDDKGRSLKKLTASHRLKNANARRERLLAEKAHLISKIRAYEELGLDASILRHHKVLVSRKALRLGDDIAHGIGHEISREAVHRNIPVVHIEDLSWVHGARYGSKWAHSKSGDSITHKCARRGVKTKKVNARNTSQSCSSCGTKIRHDTKKRLILCSDCRLMLDRDFNAALNIARDVNRNGFPLAFGAKGGTCRDAGLVLQGVGRGALSLSESDTS